jgi:hypothetical protein
MNEHDECEAVKCTSLRSAGRVDSSHLGPAKPEFPKWSCRNPPASDPGQLR